MPKFTKEEIETQIDDRTKSTLQHIIKNPDDETTDLVKGLIKEVIGLNTPHGDAAWEAAEKSQHRVHKMRKGEKAELIAAAFGAGSRFEQPVAADKAHLPIFAGKRGPVALGNGDVIGRSLIYMFQSYKQRGNLDWQWIKDEAHQKGDQQIADVVDKNLQSTDFSQGGSLIPPEFRADFIGFLHGMTAIRQLNPVFLTMANGEIRMGRVDQTVSASWIGSENAEINASTIGTDEVRLSEKELSIMVIQSERFIRQAPGGAAEMIRDDMRKVAREREEQALLRSDGTGGQPTGWRHLMAANNQDLAIRQSGSQSTAEEIIGDLLKLQEVVHGDSNGHLVPRLRPAYVLQHRTKMGLMGLVDADDNLSIIAEMLSNDQLFGVPVGTTTQLPTDLGGGDETEAYYAEMSEVMIADAVNMDITEASEATVTDSNGNDVKLYNSRQRALRLVHAMDQNVKHRGAIANLGGVDWGADILGL